MAGSPKKRARREEQARRNTALVLVPPPEPEAEPTDRWGRPRGDYRPEYADQARVLCEEGMTDKELARFFSVNRATIYNWQFSHPEFAEAMKLGKSQADDRLERTAYEVAMGYTTTIKELVRLKDNQGNERIEYFEKEVVIPPNPHVLMWMLKNRRPDSWRDKVEQTVEHTHILLSPQEARARLEAKLSEIRQGQLGTK